MMVIAKMDVSWGHLGGRSNSRASNMLASGVTAPAVIGVPMEQNLATGAAVSHERRGEPASVKGR